MNRILRPRASFRLRRGFAALLLLAAAPVLAAPPAAIMVVSDDNYPPYIFRDAEGHLKGILPDQWSLWEKKTGVKVDLRAMDWGEAQRVMQAGQADVIDTIFRTPEREQFYAFTPPYAEIKVPVYSHTGLGGIADIDSLQGFTIGVKAGDAVVGHLTNRQIHTLREYPSYEAIIQAAQNDEIKVFSVDEPAAIYYLYKHGINDRFRQSFVLYTGEFHRAVWKNRPELLDLVQSGFARISGAERRAIERKWMGTPFTLELLWRRWRLPLLVLAAVLLLLAAGNAFLARRVRARTGELRQTLNELQQSRNRLQSIFKVAPVGIGAIADRRIVEINDTFCRMSGFSREEVIGQSVRLFYASQEEFDRVGRIFYPQIAQSGTASLEILGRQKNGHVQHWWLNGAAIDPAQPAAGFIFTILDITERKLAEEALRTSHAYFSTVFDAINDAIFIHDAATFRVLDVNQRMLEMYGYPSRKEAIDHFNQMTAGDPPFSMADAAEWMRKARDEGPQVFEWLARHRDGHPFWIEVGIRSMRIGPDIRLIVTVRDITERKKAEEDRLRYERRLQEAQKMESLGLLAGGIAHDFNNLLTAILGNIDLALLDIPRNSPARDDLLTAVNATRRAAGLAQQMLDYSGKGRFVVDWVEVPEAIREITQMLKASISKSATLRLDFPASLPPIEADASQLRQVVMNLVLNASEALENKPGTIGLTAYVVNGQHLPPARLWPPEKLAPGPYLCIEVADTGVGMPPETLERIFDPFFSTKFTGRGLGLAAVLGIVRGHRGAIQVESAPGKGTTFRIYFPAGSPPPGAAAPAAAPAPAARVREGLVLLVDDEPDVRDTTSKLLGHLGYQVLCAADGQQAVQLFRAQAPRLAAVILDMTMPHLDGVQALTEFRRLRSDIPVLISSGYSEASVTQRFAGLQIAGFIPKPYTLDGLREALDRALPAT